MAPPTDVRTWPLNLATIAMFLSSMRLRRVPVVQGLKATHQCAIDNGSWDNGWLLTTLPDPLRRERFGGEEEELAGA